MIDTDYGKFNGDLWEQLCQLVFKSKYHESYQEMKASPGDYGIEGFVKHQGIVFQCYCPNNEYTHAELYEKQRDKITKDLLKLKTYENEIKARIGDMKIKQWIFVTPEIYKNELISHARKKEQEIKDLDLSIIDADFEVLVRDADFYSQEIRKIQAAMSYKVSMLGVNKDDIKFYVDSPQQEQNEYEKNIERKNKARSNNRSGKYDKDKHSKLNEIVLDKLIQGDNYLKQLEKTASEIYFEVLKVINQYESEVSEISICWEGTPQELLFKVKDELRARLQKSIKTLAEVDCQNIADCMASKWLAFCPLEIDCE